MGNFSSKPVEKDLEKQVKEMEGWEVDLYRNNPYVHWLSKFKLFNLGG